jgi:hypothetical protein
MTQSKLAAALKTRFPGGPKEVLRVLGIDETVIAPTATGGNGDKLKALRVDLERLLSENKNSLPDGFIGKILALLDERVDLSGLPESDPHAERVRAINGADTAEEDVAKVRAFLTSKGMNESDVAKAIALAKGQDDLPRNGAAGGMGGKVTGDRRIAMDARARVDAMFGTARIISEPSLAAGLRPRAPAFSREAERTFDAMFPDAPGVGPV